MRTTRTLATAGLAIAALGLAGTATIASAAPQAATGEPNVRSVAFHEGGKKADVSTVQQAGKKADVSTVDQAGKKANVSTVQQAGKKKAAVEGGNRSLAFAQDGRDNFHP